MLSRFLKCTGLTLCVLGGCTAISIAPTCPNELRVGESGPVRANEENPGAIATYLWEVFPPEAGVFADPTAPNTTFEALVEVDVVIRLTASDGLFQVVSECSTQVQGFVGISVSLEADPDPALVGEPVTLTCTSVGEIDPAVLAIAQVDGGDVELTDVSDGVATFTPTQIGDLTFRCVGESTTGQQSEAAFVTVGVTLSPPANDNDNENLNDNGADNDNTDDNENENENDNASDNENTNENENGGGRKPPGSRN
jgi:hypothetical protein